MGKMSDTAYFAMIPSTVMYDERLSYLERLLYGTITLLTKKDGYCYASNGYIAKLYGCNELTISRHISKLNRLGYITVVIEDNYKRRIYVNLPKEGVIQNNQGGYTESSRGLYENDKGVIQNRQDNNIRDNNNLINEKKGSEPGQTDFAEVSKEYDKRYPMTLSSFKSQQLADILANYGKEATLFAIRESLTANAVKPIEYIRSVAMNYSRKKENGQKTEPKRESLEEIGKRIKEETEKARAEGKSMTPDEMKQKVSEEMKRKGMKIVGNSTPA
jgi:hypothetical protein